MAKVFISWSGERSKQIAAVLHVWLPQMIQAVDPFYSRSDIQKGKRWNERIASELDDSDYGIVCLTPYNTTSTWIHFEAGAILKSVTEGTLNVILFGLSPGDIESPLADVQLTNFDKDDFYKTVESINRCCKERAIEETTLKLLYDKLWPDLENAITPLLQHDYNDEQEDASTRTSEDMIEEVLERVRSIEKKVNVASPRSIGVTEAPTSVNIRFNITSLTAEADDYEERIADFYDQISDPLKGPLKGIDVFERSVGRVGLDKFVVGFKIRSDQDEQFRIDAALSELRQCAENNDLSLAVNQLFTT